MGKPAKKRSYWEAKKRRAGELQAEAEYARKKLKEDPIQFISEKLIKAIDRIDPIEILAVGATTVIIHNTILGTKNFLDKARDITSKLNYDAISDTFIKLIQEKVLRAETEKPIDISGDDVGLWIISFVIAFFICRYSGQIFGLLEKGIGGITGLMLGV